MKTFLALSGGACVVLLGISFAVMSMSPPDFATARGALYGAVIAAVIWFILWVSTTDDSLTIKIAIGILVGIIAFGGLPFGLFWIGAHEGAKATGAPASTLTVRIECDWGPLPAVMPTDGHMYYLPIDIPLDPSAMPESTLPRGWFNSFGPPGSQTGWFKEGIARIGTTCKIDNYTLPCRYLIYT